VKVITRKKMYQTLFCGERADYLALTQYLHYLFAENVREKLLPHPLFKPSELWNEWAGETFIGFSTDRLLLQGGHAFPDSLEVEGHGMGWPSKRALWQRVIQEMRTALRGDPVKKGHVSG